MSSSEPSKWTTALGASADVNVIPATTPAGTGLASMASIFPAITQVPIDSGGIAPERADFNALFKMLGDRQRPASCRMTPALSLRHPCRQRPANCRMTPAL